MLRDGTPKIVLLQRVLTCNINIVETKTPAIASSCAFHQFYVIFMYAKSVSILKAVLVSPSNVASSYAAALLISCISEVMPNVASSGTNS